MFLPKAKKYFTSNLKEYLDNLKKIFNSIQEVSNSDVIIDSSKSPVYSYLLSLLDDVDLYVIHLIRDPRGVAYSRQKKMIQPDKSNLLYMECYSSFKSSLLWDVRNITSEIMWGSKHEHYLKLKYEDFIENPKNIVLQILKMLNLSPSKLPFISDDEVELGMNHSVWGNPSRFKVGKVKLKIDNEWKEKLNTKDRLISSVVTFPLLLKYGYSKLFEKRQSEED